MWISNYLDRKKKKVRKETNYQTTEKYLKTFCYDDMMSVYIQ